MLMTPSMTYAFDARSIEHRRVFAVTVAIVGCYSTVCGQSEASEEQLMQRKYADYGRTLNCFLFLTRVLRLQGMIGDRSGMVKSNNFLCTMPVTMELKK